MASVNVVKDQGILNITLNRPEQHNAFNPEMITQLTEAFHQANDDEQVRLVLLSGSGKSFCSGADLEWMKSMADYKLKENLADAKNLFDMFEAGKCCQAPIVGRLHGNVMGGALGLAAICDIAVAVEETRFCFSEVRLGLAPATISPFVIRKISPRFAHEWMLTGKMFSAEDAREAGLVSYVGSESAVDEIIKKVISRILQCGPEAVRETKKLLNFVVDANWSEVRDETARVIAERRVGPEGQEGLRTFFNKESPSWRESLS